MSALTTTDLEVLLGEIGLETPIPSFPAANVLIKPLDIARSYIADSLSSYTECDPNVAYSSIQWPNNIYNGDLSVILPKIKPGADSDELAFDLMKKFSSPLFLLPIPDGVHLRIMFNPQALQRLVLSYILSQKQKYGLNTCLGLRDPSSSSIDSKTMVVEFSSPNIASYFQSKHLRSTILGACIANLYSSMGWKVAKINYLGDWGKPIGLLGVGWDRFGSEESFKSDPVSHLHDVYERISELFAPEQAASKRARNEGGDPAAAEVEAHGLFAERNAFFKRLEEGEATAIAFWERARDACVQEYRKHYARLNVTFDEYSGESRVSQATMAEVESILKDKDLLQESGGASMIDMKKHGGKAGTVIIRDRDGSDTYILRDLAAVIERSRKYSFDKMIYVVATDHTMHFSNVFRILTLMGMSDLASKLQHVHFSSPSKVSANVDMLGHAIDRCQTAMGDALKAEPEKAAVFGDADATASVIGVKALLAHELFAKRGADHPFDIDHMTSFESNTGPNLQYWFTRLSSVVNTAQCGKELSALKISDNSKRDSVLGNEIGKDNEIKDEGHIGLLRLLIQYPDITQSAFNTLEPATLLSYLIAVTDQLSSCFESNGCEDSGNCTPGEINLYEATQQVLENGMKVLGIASLTN